jgi:hypothetical protein
MPQIIFKKCCPKLRNVGTNAIANRCMQRAASGSIETLHILNPIRRMIPGVHFRAEEVVGTPNGTFVNDQRIQRHVVASGDAIRLGRTLFTYCVPPAEQG